jgi:hypothetical protein
LRRAPKTKRYQRHKKKKKRKRKEKKKKRKKKRKKEKEGRETSYLILSKKLAAPTTLWDTKFG